MTFLVIKKSPESFHRSTGFEAERRRPRDGPTDGRTARSALRRSPGRSDPLVPPLAAGRAGPATWPPPRATRGAARLLLFPFQPPPLTSRRPPPAPEPGWERRLTALLALTAFPKWLSAALGWHRRSFSRAWASAAGASAEGKGSVWNHLRPL